MSDTGDYLKPDEDVFDLINDVERNGMGCDAYTCELKQFGLYVSGPHYRSLAGPIRMHIFWTNQRCLCVRQTTFTSFNWTKISLRRADALAAYLDLIKQPYREGLLGLMDIFTKRDLPILVSNRILTNLNDDFTATQSAVERAIRRNDFGPDSEAGWE